MKHLALSIMAVIFVTAFGPVSAQAIQNSRGHRGSGCESNPYSQGYVLGCRSDAAGKKRNALATHHTKHRVSQ
jgi:hypothetical protein